MATKADYYETLNIPKNATDDEIKKAYRKLAKKFHPDANPNDKTAETKFKEIGEAYAVLSDQQKRANYDQFGHSAFSGSDGGFSNDFDASDIFETFFGSGGSPFDSFFGGRRNGPVRGADVQVNIKISFEESYFGVTKEISVLLMESCANCKGSGAKPGTYPATCKVCRGTGQETFTKQFMGMHVQQTNTCRSCGGEGKIIEQKCTNCNGKGQSRVSKNFEINIPKGIENGMSIRLQGKGEPGKKGGGYGDLLVTVYVNTHDIFSRKDNDMYLEVPVTFVQAALGSNITIPTLMGEEKHQIKEGTQTGTVIKLRGKGFVNIRNSKVVGDLVVTIRVTVPTTLNEKQKNALLIFAEEMGEEYRDHKKGFFDKLKDTFK